MFFIWTVVIIDLLPAAVCAGLIAAVHRWSRTPRALNAWARALAILGAQLVVTAVLLGLLLLAIFSTPDIDEARPIPLRVYLAAIAWCAGPALTGLVLRAAARSLRTKAERAIMPREIEAFS